MATHAVRFKGLLFKAQRERLARAGIEIQSSEPSLQVGLLATGRPIYTATVDADSPDEALATVRQVMEPDTATFSDWEAAS